MTTSSLPEASISSQPTQRVALPQASTSPPSAFQMRMKASAFCEDSMAMSWSQPTPLVRSAMARACSAAGRNGASRASTTTKSLPSPFIFRNGRLMARLYRRKPRLRQIARLFLVAMNQPLRPSPFVAPEAPRLDPAKFRDPLVTAKGEARARVGLKALTTLWFNTGTLCNLTCLNCYIESSPTNDALAYLSAAEARAYLDEIAALGLPVREIGFTGGEPFMNPDIVEMIAEALDRGFEALVLTNAMKPMEHRRADLRKLKSERLTIRVS